MVTPTCGATWCTGHAHQSSGGCAVTGQGHRACRHRSRRSRSMWSRSPIALHAQPGRWCAGTRRTTPATSSSPQRLPDHVGTPHEQRLQGSRWHHRTTAPGIRTTRYILWASSPRDRLGPGLRYPSRPRPGNTAGPATGRIQERKFVPANCLCKPGGIHTRKLAPKAFRSREDECSPPHSRGGPNQHAKSRLLPTKTQL